MLISLLKRIWAYYKHGHGKTQGFSLVIASEAFKKESILDDPMLYRGEYKQT